MTRYSKFLFFGFLYLCSGLAFADVSPVTRVTASGHHLSNLESSELTRAGILDVRAFGQAWMLDDESETSKTIWGDLVTGPDAQPLLMNEREAIDYCVTIGAHLPTKEQFARLGFYLGVGTDAGYVPEVIPHLIGNYFKSSSIVADATWGVKDYYDFSGSTGKIDFCDALLNFSGICDRDGDREPIRCVTTLP